MISKQGGQNIEVALLVVRGLNRMRSEECIACTEGTRTTQPQVYEWVDGGGGVEPFGSLADRKPVNRF